MDYFPIFMNLRDQHCLVVGGGSVARRKAEALAKSGARIRLVAPQVNADLLEMADANGFEVHQRPFQPADLEGVVLAIAATDDEQTNRQVAQLANSNNLPINVVDRADLSSFITPAVVDRSPVIVAVSSGGRAPVLTRLLKARLETLIPLGLGTTGGAGGPVPRPS